MLQKYEFFVDFPIIKSILTSFFHSSCRLCPTNVLQVPEIRFKLTLKLSQLKRVNLIIHLLQRDVLNFRSLFPIVKTPKHELINFIRAVPEILRFDFYLTVGQRLISNCKRQRIIFIQNNAVYSYLYLIMDPQEQDIKHWFVLRDFKKWNAKFPAYQTFSKMGIRNFTPMHWVIRERGGKRKREYVPVIQDLLFAYDTRHTLDPIIERDASLQYKFARGCGQANPMIVSDSEMERFINAIKNDPSPKYLTPEEIKPEMIGREIIVNGGPLNGYQGRLLKIQGSKKKRLIVKIEGLMIAAVEVNPEYITLV